MKEIITIQIGQCGNQVGLRYWDVLRNEHSHSEEGHDSFFHTTQGGPIRARAILVDSEEGVVSQLMRSPLRSLFDPLCVVTDVSGAGNNWAHGYSVYGRHHGPGIIDRIRLALEACESPQAFVFLHSAGGGTGSGLGSYILEAVADAFPEPYRIAASLLPGDTDDVITSPYNALLSTSRLVEFADVVFPVENQALIDICAAQSKGIPSSDRVGSRGGVNRNFGGGGGGGGGVHSHPPLSSTSLPSPAFTEHPSSSTSSSSSSIHLTNATTSTSPAMPSALQSLLEAADSVLAAAGEGSRGVHHPGKSSDLDSRGGCKSSILENGSSGKGGANSGSVLHAAPPFRGGKARAVLTGGNGTPAAGARLPIRVSRLSTASRPGMASGNKKNLSGATIGQRLNSLGGKNSTANSNGLGRPAVQRLDSGGLHTKQQLQQQQQQQPQRDRHSMGDFTPSDAESNSMSGGLAGATVVSENKSVEDDVGGAIQANEFDCGGDEEGNRSEAVKVTGGRSGTAWDSMNDIVARMLSDLTSSMRFKGNLNMDLNEIASTLVPFPRLHFLTSSLSPLRPTRDTQSLGLDALVAEALTKSNTLLRGNLRGGTHLACGLIYRGANLSVSEVVGSVRRLSGDIPLVHWNPDGFKVAMCGKPSHYAPTSALLLSNNKCVASSLENLYNRFLSLYRVRAHLHHYLDYIEGTTFLHAAEAVDSVVKGYQEL